MQLDLGLNLGRKTLAHLLLCRQLIQRRQYKRALMELDSLLEDRPDLGVGHYFVGVVFAMSGDVAKAKTALLKAIEKGYAGRPAWLFLGHLELELNRTEAALAAVDQAIRLDPTSGPSHQFRALLLAKLDRKPEAVQAYENAIRLCPQSRPLRYRLAQTLLELGKDREAEQTLISALRLNPLDLNSRINLGDLLLQLDESDTALAEFQEAIDLQLDVNHRLHARLGHALAKLGRDDDAERVLIEVVQQNPKDFDSFVLLSRMYLAQERFDEAVQMLEKAVGVDDSLVEVVELLGKARAKAKSTLRPTDGDSDSSRTAE